MQRLFLPLNLIFNADFQKINAEIPFTPSYLEPCIMVIQQNNFLDQLSFSKKTYT